MNIWGYRWPRKKVLVHCDNQAVVDIWKKETTNCPEVMAFVCMLYFCAAQYSIHVLVTHIVGTDNSIADALSCFQVHRFRQLAPGAAFNPDSIRAWPIQLLRDSSSWALQQLCTQYVTAVFPASPHTLSYFCCYMACQVSYKTIKVYFAGICLEHLERGLEDPTKDELLHLLCIGIKGSQGVPTHTRLLITINVLRTLKSKLRHDPSFFSLEKRLRWAAFTLAFYGFLGASEFATSYLIWQHIHFGGDRYTMFIEQSKTDPFHYHHHSCDCTSTCLVQAFRLYAEATRTSQDNAPVFKGGQFSPLDSQLLSAAYCKTLNTAINIIPVTALEVAPQQLLLQQEYPTGSYS